MKRLWDPMASAGALCWCRRLRLHQGIRLRRQQQQQPRIQLPLSINNVFGECNVGLSAMAYIRTRWFEFIFVQFATWNVRVISVLTTNLVGVYSTFYSRPNFYFNDGCWCYELRPTRLWMRCVGMYRGPTPMASICEPVNICSCQWGTLCCWGLLWIDAVVSQ